MSSTEEPESSTAGARYVIDGEERRLAFRIRSPNAPLPAQRPSNPLFEDAHVVPVAGRTGTPDNDEGMTDEEDWRSIGAAALRGNRGSIIPHRKDSAPGVDHTSGKR